MFPKPTTVDCNDREEIAFKATICEPFPEMLEKFPTAASNWIVDTNTALSAVRSNQPFPEANVKELTFSDDIKPWPELIKFVEPLNVDK